MRKIFLLAAVVAALAIPVAALAADWDNTKNGDLVAQGAACPQGGSGPSTGGAWYHFVLNQVTPDYAPGITLSATFALSSASGVTPTAINKSVQHFDVFGIGLLDSASTTGGGPNAKLVISGVICGKKGTPARG
jgi:hypothetical protein